MARSELYKGTSIYITSIIAGNMFTGIDFRFNGSRGKIFKLEIGNFFSFSLLSDIDQAHGFDEHALPSWILLVL